MKTYLIPGLGFDRRIFRKLDLGDMSPEHLDWIEPTKNEPFASYAQRLAQDIDDQSGKTILIGHSMGGMASLEISRLKKIDLVILVSSIRSRAELPAHFKVVRPLAIHKLFTKGMTINTLKYWAERHDYAPGEEQELFADMVGKQSNHYLQWALKTLSKWRGADVPARTRVMQVHGQKDRTFPFTKIKSADQSLADAGHFMVYKHPEFISEFILRASKT